MRESKIVCRLYQDCRRSVIEIILSCILERLLREWKYLEASFSYHIPLEVDLYFHRDYSEKFTAISLSLDSALPIATPTVKSKWKYSKVRPAMSLKRAKKARFWIFQFHKKCFTSCVTQILKKNWGCIIWFNIAKCWRIDITWFNLTPLDIVGHWARFLEYILKKTAETLVNIKENRWNSYSYSPESLIWCYMVIRTAVLVVNFQKKTSNTLSKSLVSCSFYPLLYLIFCRSGSLNLIFMARNQPLESHNWQNQRSKKLVGSLVMSMKRFLPY